MNPLAISATNVRTFESLDLDLPTGCVVIGGENGAGKSTILNLIDVALFAERGELRPLLSLGEDELTLELKFEHAGELYRVRRMFAGKGAGKAFLDLERLSLVDLYGVPNAPSLEWDTLTRETAIATQAYLEQLLGLSRVTFRASSFLAQGDGAAFTDAQPRDRKAILAEILGLDVYDRLQLQARGELRVAEDSTVELRGRITQLIVDAGGLAETTGQIVAARGELAGVLERQAVAEQQLEKAQAAQAANAAASERWLHHSALVAGAKNEQERARVAYAAAVQAGIDRDQREQDRDNAAAVATQAPELERELAAAREQAHLVEKQTQLSRDADQRDLARERLTHEATQLREHVATLNGKADHLDAHIGEAAECDRCGQALGAEAAARAAASYRAEATTAADRARLIAEGAAAELAAVAALRGEATAIEIFDVGDPSRIEQQLVAARAAGERRTTLAEQVRQLAEQATLQDELAIALAHAVDKTAVAEAAQAEAAAGVGDVAQLDAAVNVARANVAGHAAAIIGWREKIARLESAEERAQAAADELERKAADVDAIAKQVDVLKLAERAFGRDGIPALIVENAAIPQLELEANRILGDLGGATADCRVELRTQRELKSAPALRETLDIVIVTPTGERPYETFSGGERTRLNLALRIALARLLAHRRGAESRLLAIDEPDGLDAQGMDALARILAGLAGDFDRILVVSHQPQLATSFDQAILVVKDGETSRIETGQTALVGAA